MNIAIPVTEKFLRSFGIVLALAWAGQTYGSGLPIATTSPGLHDGVPTDRIGTSAVNRQSVISGETGEQAFDAGLEGAAPRMATPTGSADRSTAMAPAITCRCRFCNCPCLPTLGLVGLGLLVLGTVRRSPG